MEDYRSDCIFFFIYRILCHVISGDGEYIMEMFHEDYVNLNLLIHDRFPLLGLPPIPTLDMPHDIYKKLIHDYFVVYHFRFSFISSILEFTKWSHPLY